jgi:hypothetical protein
MYGYLMKKWEKNSHFFKKIFKKVLTNQKVCDIINM